MSIERDVNVAYIRCARKRQFKTRKLAVENGAFIARTMGKGKLKPYLCKLCGGWHLYTEKKVKEV